MTLKSIKHRFLVMLAAFIGATATWYINHEMGLGAIVANGLVGVVASTFLTRELAGITYTASFVGMSSLHVIPSLQRGMIAGLIVGIILLLTADIYKGIGGKGGTTAALATIISKNLFSFLR